ncbi:MAG TPA: DUF3307 domain-containing protein [Porphyromonadaceae bacterium]|nr:DUF3307 domain-containing protein [Porphyromonadaceae bacterium]
MSLSSILILLRMLVAHLLGDFILQTNNMAKAKAEHNKRILCLHGAVHAVLAYLFVAIWSCWYILPVIFITHVAIDYVKCRFGPSLRSFLLDQFAHLIVLICLWLFITHDVTHFINGLEYLLIQPRLWFYIIAIFLILQPSSIVLSLFTRRWRSEDTGSETLQNAGKWIGYLERFLIVVFISIGRFEAIGFLLAAKSIFRFGELNKAKDIKITEYVLIGTFASFTIAIVVGLVLASWLR